MGGPAFAAASTSSAPPGTRRRSTRLIGLHQRGVQDHPSSAPKSSPDDQTEPPPATEPAPRRSARVQLHVPGPPSSQRSRQRGARAARTQGNWIEKVEEWAKEKAVSGAPEEECVLPFLQNGAPRKESAA